MTSTFAPMGDWSAGEGRIQRLLQALIDARKRAQVEADLAYEAWTQNPGRDTRTAFEAAQGRADAIQQDVEDAIRELDELPEEPS